MKRKRKEKLNKVMVRTKKICCMQKMLWCYCRLALKFLITFTCGITFAKPWHLKQSSFHYSNIKSELKCFIGERNMEKLTPQNVYRMFVQNQKH